MTEGMRQAIPVRAPLLLALLLLMLALVGYHPRAGAQNEERVMRVVPLVSSVPVDREHSVSVILRGLGRDKVVSLDEDGDGIPDREIEWTGLGGFEFTLQYDPTVLEVTGAELGEDLEKASRTFQCLERSDEPGSFSFGCISTGRDDSGPVGELDLAKVTFLPLVAGSSPLLLVEARVADPLANGEVVLPADDGMVNVERRPVATAVLPPDGTTATTPSPIAGATPPSSGDGTAPTAVIIGGVATPTGLTVSEDGASGKDPEGDGSDPEAENERSANSGGGSQGSQALWLGGAVGGLAALGAAGLTAVVWQRRNHRHRPQ